MTTSSETPEQQVEHPYAVIGRIIGRWTSRIFGILFVAVAGIVGYQSMDEHGWIPHNRTLDLYMTSSWLVGENRTCSLNYELDNYAKPMNKLISLICPMGDETLQRHNITVTFKGLIAPVDFDGKFRGAPEQWMCNRESDKFSCTPIPPTQ